MATQTNRRHTLIVWQGYEYEHREKTRDWYWVLAIVAIAVAIAGIFFQNYVFSILSLVAAFAIAIHATKKPDLKEFRIDNRGIRIGTKLYPRENIDSFWLEEQLDPPHLFFEVKKGFMPLIIIPIDTPNHSAVKEILIEYIPEKRHEIPLSHRLFDYFGF